MEDLHVIYRGETKFYCFIEVCSRLFPGISKSTVRSRLKALDISCTSSSVDEQKSFKKANPCLNLSGSFGLIRHQDMIVLVQHRPKNSPAKEQLQASASGLASCSYTRTAETGHAQNSPSTASCSYIRTAETGHAQNIPSKASCSYTKTAETVPALLVSYEDSSSEEDTDVQGRCAGILTSDPESCVSPAGNVACVSSKLCTGRESAVVTSASQGLENESGKRKRKDRSCYKLSSEEMPAELKEELKHLRHFYSKPINCKRDNDAFSVTTMDKLIERVKCFMFFCKNHKNIVNLSLALYNDESIVSDYVKFLCDVRQLLPSTCISILTVAINVVKYNFSDNAGVSVQVEQFRRLQRHFSRQAYVLSRRKKEGLTTKSGQQFYFAHILEVLRNLRDKVHASTNLRKARHLHDFVMLALYLRAMPGRSHEIRTLKLYVCSAGETFQHSDYENENFIVFDDDGSVVIVENVYKTAKSAGPTKLEITDDVELLDYLRKYIMLRPQLLLGKSHDFFYLGYTGEPFRDSATFSKYLSNLFEREVSIRASTNALRHAIVTYFKSIDESKDVSVRESLACLMKHSVRYQEGVYNDLTHEDKTKKGRSVLRDTMATSVFEQRDERLDSKSDSEEGSSSDEIELRPNVGDICALLDNDSTSEHIMFFLAKVARFTEDRSEAHLIHLEKLDDSEGLFKAKPGKVWKEQTNALIYPIDIVYNISAGAYELRTSAQDIYASVHS